MAIANESPPGSSTMAYLVVRERTLTGTSFSVGEEQSKGPIMSRNLVELVVYKLQMAKRMGTEGVYRMRQFQVGLGKLEISARVARCLDVSDSNIV